MALDVQKDNRYFRTPFMQKSVLFLFQKVVFITSSIEQLNIEWLRIAKNQFVFFVFIFLDVIVFIALLYTVMLFEQNVL
jgi:hypothetical protein